MCVSAHCKGAGRLRRARELRGAAHHGAGDGGGRLIIVTVLVIVIVIVVIQIIIQIQIMLNLDMSRTTKDDGAGDGGELCLRGTEGPGGPKERGLNIGRHEGLNL